MEQLDEVVTDMKKARMRATRIRARKKLKESQIKRKRLVQSSAAMKDLASSKNFEASMARAAKDLDHEINRVKGIITPTRASKGAKSFLIRQLRNLRKQMRNLMRTYRKAVEQTKKATERAEAETKAMVKEEKKLVTIVKKAEVGPTGEDDDLIDDLKDTFNQ